MIKQRHYRIAGPLLLGVICVLSVVSCDPERVVTGTEDIDLGARYGGYTTESIYLTMRDGVRIAADVTLPAPLGAGAQIPTILKMTRYWRASEGEGVDWRAEQAAYRGYATVEIDERGTGASFGTWPYPWSEAALADLYEIVDWIVQQGWSNGRVGSYGSSYSGMSAQLLPTVDHPAVQATIPAFTQYDLYTDISFPGGVHLDWFMSSWSEIVLALDRNEWPLEDEPDRSVKRVDEDWDGSLLEQAVAEHVSNGDVYLEGTMQIRYRDELTDLGITMQNLGAHGRRAALEQSDAAIYSWGSWMDHSTAHSVITRFRTLTNPQQAVIGPWRHGGGGHASPYVTPGSPPQPSSWDQWREMLNFLDRYLKEDGAGTSERVLYYYTMGAAEWKSTTVWPVQGVTRELWYFGADNSLSTSMPADQQEGDSYAIDFTATSGPQTRWHTALDSSVVYRDRRDEDGKLLTYTSEPLAEDTEITGYPIVTLQVSSTHTDGAFFVYLEDVDPSGRVTYVTEGQLRALHCKVSDEVPPYDLLIPYHSFKQQDGAPLVPGEVTEITFGLLPTSVLIRAGHRIRVAIAGHDAGLFARVPAAGDPVITVERNAVHASRIELPIVR
jgi:putative CocE/NonD family hydrolase